MSTESVAFQLRSIGVFYITEKVKPLIKPLKRYAYVQLRERVVKEEEVVTPCFLPSLCHHVLSSHLVSIHTNRNITFSHSHEICTQTHNSTHTQHSATLVSRSQIGRWHRASATVSQDET